jgi:DNA-binding NarL/FixJ family response regulator
MGLDILDREGPCAIVISDMRMPNMDGATFLGQVRLRYPDTIRVLLTGHSDIEAAIAAINEGQIFRFLNKPCPPTQLRSVLSAAAEQYRLVMAERVVLERTLYGCVKALSEVLAMNHPLAFGRTMRIHRSVSELAEYVGMKDRWRVEIAAMLSQIGCVTLPAETVEKLHYGTPLSASEQKQVSGLPFVAKRLVENIPRMDAIGEILAGSAGLRRLASFDSVDDSIWQASQILLIASDYDTLESSGLTQGVAIETMRTRGDYYDHAFLEAFAELRGNVTRRQKVVDIPIRSLQVGMVLAEDIRLQNGLMLAVRGFQVTPHFAEHARNFQARAVNKTVRVINSQ